MEILMAGKSFNGLDITFGSFTFILTERSEKYSL